MFRNEFNCYILYINVKWFGIDFVLICFSLFYLSNNLKVIEFIVFYLICYY